MHNPIRNILMGFGIAAICSAPFATVLAEESASCRIVDSLVQCAGPSASPAETLEALSSDGTSEMFQNAFRAPYPFANGDAREAYRQSLEKKRAAITTYAARSHARQRRGRMSTADFEKIRIQYRSAVMNYRLGLNVYRRGTWGSDVEPYQAD